MSETDNLPKGVKKNVSLAEYTTFQIGGRAEYFYTAKTKDQLVRAVLASKKLRLPFFVLGGGSNLLVADRGYDGLVIKIKNEKLKIKNKNKKFKNIESEAGVMLSKIVNLAVKNNLTGLEWAAGIPGTIGGAVRGNAGAFGKSISDSVKEVEVFDSKGLKIKRLKKKDCHFGYRNSIFKKKKNQSTKQSFVLGRAHKIMRSDLIILSVLLQLKKGNKKEIKRKIREFLNYRKERHPLDLPSAGSVFKNFTPYRNEVSGMRPVLKTALKKFNGRGSIPAAYLIERCGLKGKRIGNVEVSKKHTNFIVNLGGGKARDVIKLINLIKRKVKDEFGITLEAEIEILE